MRHLMTNSRIMLGMIVSIGAISMIAGCGEQAPYPESQATSLVGQSAKCESCKKQIEQVTEDNFVTIQGIRYAVCDEKCAKELEEWVKTH